MWKFTASFLIALIILGYFIWRDNYKEKIVSADCGLQLNSQQCQQKEIENKLNIDGVEAALALITGKYGKDKDFAADCHDFTHILGNAAYKKYKIGVRFTLTAEDASVCGYGFYHGFMEIALQSGDQFSEINDFCEQIQQISLLSVSKACYHGIGHGAIKFIADRHSGGFKDEEALLVNGALEICYKIVGGHGNTYDQCSGGVFMEVANKMVAHENNMAANVSDPLGICKIQNDRDKKSCYGQMYGVLNSVADSLMEGASFIEKIPEDEYAQEAMVNYSSTVATVFGDHANDIQTCRIIQKRLRNSCLKGLAIIIVFRSPVGEAYKSALEFCSSSLLSSAEQKYCTGEVLSYSAVSQTPENHKRTCDIVKNSFKTHCP